MYKFFEKQQYILTERVYCQFYELTLRKFNAIVVMTCQMTSDAMNFTRKMKLFKIE